MSLSDCFIVSVDPRNMAVHTLCTLCHKGVRSAKEVYDLFYGFMRLLDDDQVPPPTRWVGMPCPCPVCECIEEMLPLEPSFEEGTTMDWHIRNVMLKKGIYGSAV